VKVLGIGNAIVDVICKVEENFLSENNLTKSMMKLVDEVEFKKLLSNLTIKETIAGGSVANSIVGLSQLGNTVSFIGKVSNDELGNKYEKSLTNEKVKYCYQKKKESIPTGTCLILITPDSERTMCTFLGIAGKVSDKDIDENAVKNSELVFLEGYLWDEGEPRTAFNKAINISKKTAISLSDRFCVDRHKKSFLDLVNNKLDITFANEQEILSLIDAKSFDEVILFGKQLGKLLVITRGEKGSIAIQKNEVVQCDSKKDLKIVDLTGAGDLFAAGFLHGHVNNLSIKESLEKALDKKLKADEKIYYLSPKGKLFDQKLAKELSKEKTINLICGHFEGVDQRVIDSRNIIELSIGDFILSGGESAAFVVIDAILRLVPGVIGNNNSIEEETFENGLLEYPQYTKPQIWEKKSVPDVLLSGDHAKIKDWRLSQSEAITRDRRPDLWQKYKKD